jgi:N-ethylmaleimide reductase
MNEKLFDQVSLGDICIANRILMAPMTRSRAVEASDCPSELMVEYYRQRSSAGMIITEGTHPSADGKGYCRTPGIYSEEQIAAWRRITESVHHVGGKMVLQIMHCGRIGHPLNKQDGARILAPSAIAAKGEIYTEQGMKPFPVPEEMTEQDIFAAIASYKSATENAFRAGFDGVELHCASGYLPAQFLSTGTNQRVDRYGGSLENRLRFVVDVLTEMISVNGAGRVGLRICPGNPFNDLHDANHVETFSALLRRIDNMKLAYLHVIDLPGIGLNNYELAKSNYSGKIVLNDSFDFQKANLALEDEQVAAISFGRPFIANPNLPEKFRNGIPLTDFDPASLYAGGAKGYTDYPISS